MKGRGTSTLEAEGKIKYTHLVFTGIFISVVDPIDECSVAKLKQLVYGFFIVDNKMKDKQKRPPWQEAVFSVVDKTWQAIADRSAIWFNTSEVLGLVLKEASLLMKNSHARSDA